MALFFLQTGKALPTKGELGGVEEHNHINSRAEGGLRRGDRGANLGIPLGIGIGAL